GAEAENIDLFDRMQLEHVIAICRQAKSLSAAGRQLFDVSRHVMLVVDHSKFGRNAMVNMGSISMVDAVYTDAPPPVSVMQ
ncbi:hypothetical protein ACSLNR_30165, partial [Escherichia coli]